MKKILIVEDEPDIQELLRTYLEDAGYETAMAGDGVAALDLFQAQPFDLVLLDVLLPKIDGFGVCELIRRQSQTPILMLTALDGEEEQLRGFGLDIDDYVTKPFSMPVLLEKIRVILRRRGAETEPRRLRYRDLVLDLDAREVLAAGRPLELTAREFDLLHTLLRAPRPAPAPRGRGWSDSFTPLLETAAPSRANFRKIADRGYLPQKHKKRARVGSLCQ